MKFQYGRYMHLIFQRINNILTALKKTEEKKTQKIPEI
jgi:hypothetical protein